MISLFNRIRVFWYPERFQGWGRRRAYFEGWYFKVVSANSKNALAFIPGIAADGQGNRHAFVQVLDGVKRTSSYHRFPAGSFHPDAEDFTVRIDNNTFSSDGIYVDLPDYQGQLQFTDLHPWPTSVFSPGIMGPYAFAPFMECYHGVVSMDHGVKGALMTGAVSLDFTQGRGYIEKDWGRSFPRAYVWIQSNHFDRPGISMKVSVAHIPWLTGAFVGFIGGLLIDGELHQFTTYNRSKLIACAISISEVHIAIRNPHHVLEITASRDLATGLASPIHGAMEGRIEESMTSTIHVRLLEHRTQRLIFEGEGRYAGLEVAGEVDKIIF